MLIFKKVIHIYKLLQFISKVIAQYFPKFRMFICQQNCFGPRKNKKAYQPSNISWNKIKNEKIPLVFFKISCEKFYSTFCFVFSFCPLNSQIKLKDLAQSFFKIEKEKKLQPPGFFFSTTRFQFFCSFWLFDLLFYFLKIVLSWFLTATKHHKY